MTTNRSPITAAQMTTRQRETIASLCVALDRQHHDGHLSFAVEAMPHKGLVMLCVTNTHGDLRWFETASNFYCFVGTRGGVEQFAGNMRKPWSKITGGPKQKRKRRPEIDNTVCRNDVKLASP